MVTKNFWQMSMTILITFIALLIRLANLTTIALWHDEGFSVLLARLPVKELIYRTGLDVHPPFYYFLLKIWGQIFGQSLFALRAMSVLFGVLTILTTYGLLRAIFPQLKKKYLIFLMLALAFAPFQIQYSQEMRMYSLGAFLIIFATYSLVKILNGSRLKQRFLWSLALFFTSSAALYAHYYLFFSLAALVIFWLTIGVIKVWQTGFRKNKNLIFWPITSWLLALIVFLPWLKTFLFQLRQVQVSYWIPKTHWSSVPNTFLKLSLGSEANIQQNYFYILLLAVVIILIILGLVKTRENYKWLVFSMLIIPMASSLGLSFKTAIYLDRYFIFVQVFYYVLIFLGIMAVKSKIWQYCLLSSFLVLSLYGLWHYRQNLQLADKPGMTAASQYLNNNFQTGDKLFVGSSFVFFNFQYYNQTGVKAKLYAPSKVSHFSGSALLFPGDTISTFPDYPATDHYIWLINTTGFGNWQPEVPKTWQLIEENGFEDAQNRGWIIIQKYQ